MREIYKHDGVDRRDVFRLVFELMAL